MNEEGKCDRCGQPWSEHEFAVPAPYCPAAPIKPLLAIDVLIDELSKPDHPVNLKLVNNEGDPS